MRRVQIPTKILVSELTKVVNEKYGDEIFEIETAVTETAQKALNVILKKVSDDGYAIAEELEEKRRMRMKFESEQKEKYAAVGFSAKKRAVEEVEEVVVVVASEPIQSILNAPVPLAIPPPTPPRVVDIDGIRHFKFCEKLRLLESLFDSSTKLGQDLAMNHLEYAERILLENHK